MSPLTTEYVLVPPAKEPENSIKQLIADFRIQVETLESRNSQAFPLSQDGKSEAHFIDCHILSTTVSDLLDYEASLDPEEQEEIKANRDLQPLHKAFMRMQEDAKKGRQFNDIIVEYLPTGSRAEKPLKIYGGQHRAKSIDEAAKSGIERYHGFRVYFGLTLQQRNEIAQVSNTNINVPLDLFDRMQETILGPQLRTWCRSIGLLTGNQDFAERKNAEGIITARMARTLVVNFVNAKDVKGEIGNKVYASLLGKEANDKYLGWTREERLNYL